MAAWSASQVKLLPFLLVVLIALATAATGYAQPAPDPNNNNNQGSSDQVVDTIWNALKVQKVNGKVSTLMADMAVRLINGTKLWTGRVRVEIRKEADALFWALLVPILTAEMVFTGFRILMRSPISEQFLRLTTTTFILIVVHMVLIQYRTDQQMVGPDSVADTTLFNEISNSLATGGKILGAKIIEVGICEDSKQIPGLTSLTSGDRANLEPFHYWFLWLGEPLTTKEEATTISISKMTKANEFKFSVASIMKRVWGARTDSDVQDQRAPASTDPNQSGGGWLGWLKGDSMQEIMNLALGMLFPFALIATIMSIASLQFAAIMAIMFSNLAVLCAAAVVQDLVVAFAVIMLPLMYFNSFSQIWSQLLTVVAGVTMIQCFYYIFSAIGFVFTDQLYNTLFPFDGGDQSFGIVVSSIYAGCVTQITASVQGALSNAGAVLQGLAFFLATFFRLGKILFGVTLLSVIIGSGVAFASLAPTVALRWRSGFAIEETFDRVSQSLLGLQSAAGSALGAMFSDSISRSGNLARGIGGGAGKFMGR